MDPCIIAYMMLTYAIKAIIFVWIFDWIQVKIMNNFIVMLLIFTIIFAALDFFLVALLPASGWKSELRKRIAVPDDMRCVLTLDYLLKGIIFYYVYAPVNGYSYYNSSSTLMKFIIVFGIMFCVDIAVTYGLEVGISEDFAEQFCSVCSM